MPLVENFAPIMSRKLVLQLHDRFSREILEELSSQWIGSLKVNLVMHWRLIAACLVSFFSAEVKYSSHKMALKTAQGGKKKNKTKTKQKQKKHDTDSVNIFFKLLLNHLR